MKNCEEMVHSLLTRRDQYAAAQRRKRAVITRTVIPVGCVCLAALVGVGLWKGGVFDTTPPETAGDAVISGEKDYIGPDELRIISSYAGSYTTGDTSSASYATPENGKRCFSTPLQQAMDAYGDRVLYRVVVDVFRDKEPLSADSKPVQEERARLSDSGYTVAYETVSDGESAHPYLILHATYDELTGFAANERYGYFLFLYEERVEPAANSGTDQ